MAAVDYERLACEKLGLLHPSKERKDIYLELGTFRTIDSFKATQVVSYEWAQAERRYLNYVEKVWVDGEREREIHDGYKKKYDFLTLDEYMRSVKTLDPNFITPDIHGYQYYLKKHASKAYKLLERQIPALLPERARKEHTYCAASTGSGKTELLKVTAHETLTPGHAALILIDPLGSLARPIARWREFRDRLIYIDPMLSFERTPRINPLSYTPSSQDPRVQEFERHAIAKELTAVFRQLIDQSQGNLSQNMGVVLTNCIKVLLTKEKATFKDLERFMDKKRNSDLLTLASKYPQRTVREFFTGAFEHSHVNSTRNALMLKLHDYVANETFASLTCGENSFDLEQAMNERKLIVFNLSSLTSDDQELFGRFVVAVVQGIAHRRANIPPHKRVPCHFFIDECSQFVTDSIVTIVKQGRQLGLHLTLAQQGYGGGMSENTFAEVVGGSNVQILGPLQGGVRSPIKALNLHPYDLQQLNVGEFYVKMRNTPAFKLAIRTDFLDMAHTMSDSEWEETVEHQLEEYYRPFEFEEPDENAQPSYGFTDEPIATDE